MTDVLDRPTTADLDGYGPVPAIYAAIAAITDEMGFLERTGRGPSTQSSYPFLPVDSIVARLNPLLTKHGVIVVPTEHDAVQGIERFPKVNMQGEPVYDGRAPGAQIQTRLHCSFDFIATVDGSRITATAFGEALDSGDKGLRKAGTAAYKVVLLRLFTIVSGDEDPDASHPSDDAPQVARQDRGEQQRTRAAAGKTERAPRAPRQPRGTAAKAEESPAEPEEKAAPAESASGTERAEAAPAEPTPAVPAEQPATPEPDRIREQQTSAEQRSEDWKVDPEDVAHAEATAPKAREPRQPVTKPEPVTEDEKKYESVADLRGAIRDALKARDLPRDAANEMGDAMTGKPRGAWFANQGDLRKVLKAIENGEVPPSMTGDEAGF